jgi:hypothetical protein
MMDTLLAGHSAVDRVAFGSAGERTAADLLRDAGAVARALPERAADRPLALLGVRRDVYGCLAALLGAWARGYEVLLPPADATREGFLRAAQRPDVGAVLHDTASSAALPLADVLAGAASAEPLADTSCALHGVLCFAAAEGDAHAAAVRVTGAELCAEARLLGRSLELPSAAAYASALSPSSRFAWAAGVFWPLASGGALLRDDPRDPRWAAQAADALVFAAPAQLRALLRRGALARGQRVVSLGAPLPAAGAAQLQAAGLRVHDVYASERLGSLGAREPGERAFRTLLEVAITGDGSPELTVAAAHLADVPAPRIHAIPGESGGFIATGVGVMRAEWEERIAWLDGVEDAALLPLPAADADRQPTWHVAVESDDSALETRVHALLPELDIATWRSLRRRRAEPRATHSLSSFASGRCELTRNGAGRHDRASLLRLFSRDADATPLSWELSIQREHTGAEGCVRYVQVPDRYGYFAGHFPGYPLLPGAAQLSELVVPFVRSVQPELGRLTRMARLKFQERIVPNDLIEVRLSFGADKPGGLSTERSVEFWLRRGESVCATGRLWFALPAEASS